MSLCQSKRLPLCLGAVSYSSQSCLTIFSSKSFHIPTLSIWHLHLSPNSSPRPQSLVNLTSATPRPQFDGSKQSSFLILVSNYRWAQKNVKSNPKDVFVALPKNESINKPNPASQYLRVWWRLQNATVTLRISLTRKKKATEISWYCISHFNKLSETNQRALLKCLSVLFIALSMVIHPFAGVVKCTASTCSGAGDENEPFG